LYFNLKPMKVKNKLIRWPVSIKFIRMPNGTLVVKGSESIDTVNEIVREQQKR